MRQRKSYPKSFKTQVVQECEQPGVSVAAIAMRHGINANVVRRWIPLWYDHSSGTVHYSVGKRKYRGFRYPWPCFNSQQSVCALSAAASHLSSPADIAPHYRSAGERALG